MKQPESFSGSTRPLGLVVIGASSGGLEAIIRLLKHLPTQFDVPTAVVLHQRANRASGIPEMLAKYTHLKVQEPEDKEIITKGHLYVVPPNYHLLIDSGELLSLSLDAPLNYCRPAIDMTFLSAAEVFRQRLAGCVLTGANDDGARGCVAIKRHGGVVLVQDPQQAAVDIMPRAAIAATMVDEVLTVEVMARKLTTLAAGADP